MTDHWVAATDFVAVRPDGTRTAVRARLGRPYSVGSDEWRCALALDGLHEGLPPVPGGDALQALGLAWQLAGQLLASLEAQGGHLEFENGEVVPLSAYFGVSASTQSDQAL
jgi:uncharacterized protein DUF6968